MAIKMVRLGSIPKTHMVEENQHPNICSFMRAHTHTHTHAHTHARTNMVKQVCFFPKLLILFA